MLSVDQAHKSLDRVFAFFPWLTAQQISKYIQSLQEAFPAVDPFLFDKACCELVKSVDKNVLPKPATYRAYYDIAVSKAPKQSNYTPPTPDESREWCLDEIERFYTPEAAYDHLQWINDNPKIAKWVTQEVMLALIHKSGTADPGKLAARKADRDRAKKFRDILERR